MAIEPELAELVRDGAVAEFLKSEEFVRVSPDDPTFNRGKNLASIKVAFLEPAVKGGGRHVEMDSEVREPPFVRLESVKGKEDGNGEREIERTAESLNRVSGEGISSFRRKETFLIENFSNFISDKALRFKNTNALTELRIVGELREFSDWTLEREIRDRSTEPVDREQNDFRITLNINIDVVNELPNN